MIIKTWIYQLYLVLNFTQTGVIVNKINQTMGPCSDCFIWESVEYKTIISNKSNGENYGI